MEPDLYKPSFYKNTESFDSAKEIIPVVLKYTQPGSILDIGCGTGAWLHAWKLFGINDLTGLDGDYINRDDLVIDRSVFRVADLEKPILIDRKYDLVTCLEVAEHIREAYAKQLVESICSAGDLVLFSAALPFQEGTGHYNEQYPDYWVALFAGNGFRPYDCIRPEIWNNERVGWWYRQNLLFFVKEDAAFKYTSITTTKQGVLPLVHPRLLEAKQKKIDDMDRILGNPFRAFAYLIKRYSRAIVSRVKK